MRDKFDDEGEATEALLQPSRRRSERVKQGQVAMESPQVDEEQVTEEVPYRTVTGKIKKLATVAQQWGHSLKTLIQLNRDVMQR